MTSRLNGKVALITGGCSGMGSGTVELFLSEGASVVVADILIKQGEVLEKQYSPRLRFVRCDVINEADVAAAVELAVAEFGRLDITFNNAGIIGSLESAEDVRGEDWDRTFNVNVRGVMYGIKHSVPPMKARGGGAIINTASTSAVSTVGRIAYCASKSATLHLTRRAALDLAQYNIRVNAILPGFIPTPIFGELLKLTREQSESLVNAIRSGAAMMQPLKRAGTARDIAEACLFLASDAASFITGAELRVDGGQTLIPGLEGDIDDPRSMTNLIIRAAKGLG